MEKTGGWRAGERLKSAFLTSTTADSLGSLPPLCGAAATWESLPALTVDSLPECPDAETPGVAVDTDHWGIDAVRHFGYTLGGFISNFADAEAEASASCGERTRCLWRRATRVSDGKQVVVKAVSCRGELPETARQRMLGEFRLLRRFRHEAILGAESLLQTRFDSWLILDVAGGMSVQAHVDRHGPLEPARAADLFAQLLKGLSCLHAAALAHGDIRPASLLLDEAGNTLKITNLSSATEAVATAEAPVAEMSGLAPPDEAAPKSGDPAYCAPEQLFQKRRSDRSDVWAAGLSLYFKMWGALPFDVEDRFVASALRSGTLPSFPMRGGAPTDLVNVLMRCLAVDALTRPSAAEVLSDPAFAQA